SGYGQVYPASVLVRRKPGGFSSNDWQDCTGQPRVGLATCGRRACIDIRPGNDTDGIFAGMSADDPLHYAFLGAWLVIPIAVFAFCSRKGRLPGILVYAYLAGFFMNHWMGALAHASPESMFSIQMVWHSDDTVSGFHLSSLGLFAFTCGVLL